MGKLEGKVAVVTGGSTGIGFASAKLFAEEGARVFITGRRPAELEAAVKQIGRGATGFRGDVANLADLDRLYGEVQAKAGRIDVLFANAGGGAFAPLGDITEEHFDKTFGVNVKGTLFTVQKALPLLSRGASIVLTSPTTGSTATRRSASTARPRPPSGRSLARGSSTSRGARSASTPSALDPSTRPGSAGSL